MALHQLKLEDEAKGKKQAFVADLKTRLSAGGGYVKVPLVMEEFDTQEKEMLEGLKVRVSMLMLACGFHAFAAVGLFDLCSIYLRRFCPRCASLAWCQPSRRSSKLFLGSQGGRCAW